MSWDSANDALIIKEFNGHNHSELSAKFNVSPQYIWALILRQRVANVPRFLHLNAEIGQQVLWAGQATQLASLRDLRAALQALEKAVDMGQMDSSIVAIAILPEVPLIISDADNQMTSQAGLKESQPSSQSHDYINTNQQVCSQSDSLDNPEISSLPPLVEPYTPEKIRADFDAYGVTITDFCKQHNLNRMSVVDLLRGNGAGLRGDSHRAAVLLGLKPDPITKSINYPFNNQRKDK